MNERDATPGEQALYDTLHKALAAISDGATGLAEDYLLDALDGMTGFCSSRCRTFSDHVKFREPSDAA